MKEEFTQLANAYGWVQIESRNPYMISYAQEEDDDTRINVYTNGTITVQKRTAFGSMKSYKNCDLAYFEGILLSLQNV